MKQSLKRWAPLAAFALALTGAGAAYVGGAMGGAPALSSFSASAPEAETILITWADLAPGPQTEEEIRAVEEMAAALSGFMGDAMFGPESYGEGPGPGILQHGAATAYVLDGDRFVEDYDDKRVKMAGYLLPLDFSEHGSTEFLLVPFIGACIHVPPPPPNQLVLIKTETPHMPATIFEAVTVTGLFERSMAQTELAESGYKIAAEAIVAFQ
ncbi:MAG: DUF3299 domain-containing protein [Pseudomonadota bacterium]